MSAALLPCPFCGHTSPEFERLGTKSQSCIVECGWCGARHESSDEGDECGNSWNTRVAAQPPSQPLVEETCEVKSVSSRICELGTKSCVKTHAAAPVRGLPLTEEPKDCAFCRGVGSTGHPPLRCPFCKGSGKDKIAAGYKAAVAAAHGIGASSPGGSGEEP